MPPLRPSLFPAAADRRHRAPNAPRRSRLGAARAPFALTRRRDGMSVPLPCSGSAGCLPCWTVGSKFRASPKVHRRRGLGSERPLCRIVTVLRRNARVPLTTVSTLSSSTVFSASPQVRAAARSSRSRFFMLELRERAASQQLPRELPWTRCALTAQNGNADVL